MDIADATSPTYTLTADDVNATVRVLVTATNPDGTATATSTRDGHDPQRRRRSTPSGRPSAAPPQRGQTLTGTTGTWSGIGNSTSYQWQSSPDGTHLDRDRRRDRRRPTRSPPATSAATCACS